MEVHLKTWKTKNYYVLKIPPELRDTFLKLRNREGYVKVIIPIDTSSKNEADNV